MGSREFKGWLYGGNKHWVLIASMKSGKVVGPIVLH